MLKKLKTKLIITNLFLIFTVLVLCLTVVYINTKDNLKEQSFKILEGYVLPLSKDDMHGNKPPYGDKGDFSDKETPPSHKKNSTSVFAVKMSDSGKITAVFDYYKDSSEEIIITLQEYADKAIGLGSARGELENERLRYILKMRENEKYIVFQDMTSEIRSLESLRQSFYIVGITAVFIVLTVSIVITHISLSPVERAWKKQRQFVADASHELKTPLTIILANTDILLTEKSSVDENGRKWVERTKAEGERMKELISNMLYLARADDEADLAKKHTYTSLNFSDIVMETLLNFEIQCFETGKVLNQNVEESLFINGSRQEITQLVAIFLDNAFKYSDKNGTISVKLEINANTVTLSVNNTGSVIPQKDLPRIFERFYRSSESRAREEGGYGLGLSIAKTIVTSHGGKILAESNEKSGTTFTVSFKGQKIKS